MLDIDRYSAAELRALDAINQLGLLNELLGEVKRLGDLKCMAIDVHADARMRAINEPTPVNKAAVVDARRHFDKLAVAISARKQQASILQTLVRAIPA